MLQRSVFQIAEGMAEALAYLRDPLSADPLSADPLSADPLIALARRRMGLTEFGKTPFSGPLRISCTPASRKRI
jgi:hypothetical protein